MYNYIYSKTLESTHTSNTETNRIQDAASTSEQGINQDNLASAKLAAKEEEGSHARHLEEHANNQTNPAKDSPSTPSNDPKKKKKRKKTKKSKPKVESTEKTVGDKSNELPQHKREMNDDKYVKASAMQSARKKTTSKSSIINKITRTAVANNSTHSPSPSPQNMDEKDDKNAQKKQIIQKKRQKKTRKRREITDPQALPTRHHQEKLSPHNQDNGDSDSDDSYLQESVVSPGAVSIDGPSSESNLPHSFQQTTTLNVVPVGGGTDTISTEAIVYMTNSQNDPLNLIEAELAPDIEEAIAEPAPDLDKEIARAVNQRDRSVRWWKIASVGIILLLLVILLSILIPQPPQPLPPITPEPSCVVNSDEGTECCSDSDCRYDYQACIENQCTCMVGLGDAECCTDSDCSSLDDSCIDQICTSSCIPDSDVGIECCTDNDCPLGSEGCVEYQCIPCSSVRRFANGAFEHAIGEMPSCWIPDQWHSSNSTSLDWGATFGFNESGGVRIINYEYNDSRFYQHVGRLVVGEAYRVRGMVKLESLEFGEESVECGASISRIQTWDHSPCINVPSSEWHQVEFTFEAESDTEKIGCRLGYYYGVVKGVMYCDNLEIEVADSK